MSEINPYAPPTEPSDAEVTSVPFQMDGPYLIVKSGVCLPMRCVITNQPVGSDDLVRRRLQWAPSFRFVLSHHQCELEYFINAAHRRLIFVWSRLLPTCIGFIALAIALVLGSPIVLFLAIAAVQLLGRFTPRDPLRIKRRQGKRFWIEGINPEFLAACASAGDRQPIWRKGCEHSTRAAVLNRF